MTDLERATAWWEKYFSHWPEDDAEIETLAAEFAAVRAAALEEALEAVLFHHDVPDFRMVEIREYLARQSGGGGEGK